MKNRKKLMILFLSVFLLFSGGCRRNRKPNERRGTNYRYDFMDFIDINIYGENGSGYIEVHPIDINLEDFENEYEYINVKKDLDTFNMYFKKGDAVSTKLKLSKTEGLSNGDIIRISLSGVKRGNTYSDMNVEPYEYVVDGLGELKQIDLFDPNFVTFFATNDGYLYSHIKNKNMYEKELTENIQYKISTNDMIQAGKTVLFIDAFVPEEYLVANGYNVMDVFMTKLGYKAWTHNERVLDDVLDPIEFGAASSMEVERVLYEYLYLTEGQSLVKICNLQQTPRQKSAEPYCYMVLFSLKEGDYVSYFRKQVKMVYVDGEYVVLEGGNRESTSEEYVYRPYEESNMLLNFTLESWNSGEEEENAETAETAENTSETETAQEGEESASEQTEATPEGEATEQPAEQEAAQTE